MHVARRKEIYEALHPETKHGHLGNNQDPETGKFDRSRQVGDNGQSPAEPGSANRFTQETSKATGDSERKVQRGGMGEKAQVGQPVTTKATQ